MHHIADHKLELDIPRVEIPTFNSNLSFAHHNEKMVFIDCFTMARLRIKTPGFTPKRNQTG